ncbi:hypothetical protein [Streptomyces purpureus]|uniref:Uncharacterized protein n=1 Tax=Streptomyces purpureus TaxID=1951 RepID=A0A918GWJ8_9ACTN|nr:hypothetical protein [Streptomyces purpureus]GGT13745.1 hypothetical protein GCM10014713_02880 [Streptomyces purpureus]
MKRHVARAGAGLGALALLAGGIFCFGGGYDRWSTGRLLTNACDGVLPAAGVRSVLGERHLKADDDSKGSLDDTSTSLRVVCGVSRDTEKNAGKHADDGSVTVTVNGVPTLDREDRRYESLYPTVRSGLPPAPLGQGWNGVFSVGDSHGEGKATTAVLLDCAPGRGDLLVTVSVNVDGYVDDSPLDNPERRTAFVRIATDTATNASRRWNCDADLGEALTTVPLPVNKDEYVAPADAKGTCSGITARGKAVARAWESERGTAPFEECILGNAEGHTTYRLAAHYGPYTEGARHDHVERSGDPDPIAAGQRSGVLANGSYWTTATCPGGGEPALFTLVPYDDKAKRPEADRAYALSVLKAFAERSAAAHRCAAPAAPTTTTEP